MYMQLRMEGPGFVRLIYSYIDLNTIYLALLAIYDSILLTSCCSFCIVYVARRLAISMPYMYRTPICVWDSKTILYTYGISHMHIGRPIHIRDKIHVLYRTLLRTWWSLWRLRFWVRDFRGGKLYARTISFNVLINR